MSKLYVSSYGNISFQTFSKEHIAYVDKTLFIKELEELNANYPILLRPRRFGKSMFVQMLKYFYDLSYADQYETVFQHTKIAEENLDSHNTYHVLDFDFSGLNCPDLNTLISNFSQSILSGISNFKARYPKFTFNYEGDLLNPNIIIQQFCDYYYQNFSKEKKLYILIDEYDNFANDLLNQDRELFKTITSSNGFVKNFYAKIKAYTKNVVAKTFITGVSSISLDSITSGFNIAKNITTDLIFNEFAGFTKEELKAYILKLMDFSQYSFNVDQMLTTMQKAFNGYSFSRLAKNTVFNSSMCIYYIDEVKQSGFLLDPELHIDPACHYDPTKLRDLFNHSEPKVINKIINQYYTTNEFKLTGLVENININQIDCYDYATIISILYYLGYLTIKPQAESDLLTLTCPNQAMKKIFRKCFFKYYLYPEKKKAREYELNIDCFLNKDQNIDSFISSCEDYLGKRLTNQHLRSMKEPYLVGIIKTKLEEHNELKSKDEFSLQIPRVGERFVDLYIEPDRTTCYLLEFKYISKSSYEQNKGILEQRKQEAIDQLNCYRNADNLKEFKIYAYALIFVDCKCVLSVQV